MSFDYIRDPDEIYNASFATVTDEVRLDHLPKEMHPVAIRLVHSCGMTDVVDDLDFSAGAVRAAKQAFGSG